MIDELLRDNYSLDQAKQIQDKYVKILQMQPVKKHEILKINQIDLILGVDISFFYINTQEYGVACAVLWDYHDNRIIDKYFSIVQEIIFTSPFGKILEISIIAPG